MHGGEQEEDVETLQAFHRRAPLEEPSQHQPQGVQRRQEPINPTSPNTSLQAVQQQLALQAGGTVAAPPIPAFVPMTQPPPPAPVTGHSAGRGRRNARRGAGRGRGNPTGIPPPSAIGGAIPTPAAGGTTATGGYQSNITKYYNNNNYCYSCGFDVAAWHTSSTCPANYRKNGH